MTLNGCIIMGRKTWDSLKNKPLPDRYNIVISGSLSDATLPQLRRNYYVVGTFEAAYQLAKTLSSKITVIGGGQVYRDALQHWGLNKVYVTRIPITCHSVTNPIYFPELKIDPSMTLLKTEIKNASVHYNGTQSIVALHYETYERKKSDSNEQGYLNLLATIMKHGNYRKTRNGMVASIFSHDLSFDLNFPLITTKRVPMRMIAEELLEIFIRGKTDSKVLEAKNIKVWQGNTTREFLDARGLTDYQEGDMGPMYGFNWNHFGAKYKGCNADYSAQGYDQLAYVMETLATDPSSRRIIMTTWNPAQTHECCLYPCHGILVQFYTHEHHGIRHVDCKMTQRSADAFLGLVWNISSYALLVHLMCATLTKRTGVEYEPRKLYMSLGDVHIYEEHFDAVMEQLQRTPHEPPTLAVVTAKDKLSDYNVSDFVLNNYHPDKAIKASMVA